MGDQPGSPSWVCMSEDKVRRKDLCGSVRVVYVLEKLPDVSGPDLVEAGRYTVDALCPNSCGLLFIIIFHPRCSEGNIRW